MTWDSRVFGELYLESSRNGIYKKADFHGHGTKIVNMGELFAYGKVGEQPMQYVEITEKEAESFLLHENDLLFARRSLVESGAGKVSIVHNLVEDTTFESSIIRVRLDPKKCSPLFYYYWFMSPKGRAAILPLVTGINVKGIRGTELCNIEVDYPPICVQERIASTLSAYDDLIENNQKQIKLLEEAAQRLYKEWFVDLRFPGYEDTPIVDGVPKGWEKHPFSQKVSILSGGTPRTENKEYYNGTIPFYSPKDSNNDFFAYDTITHISQAGLENCNSKLYPKGTIIITARGTVGKTTILATEMAMNQSCYALKCETLDLPYYLFFSLRQEVEKLKQMANGGVFDTIIIKTFDNIHLVFPSNGTAQMFERVVTPFMESIQTKLKYVMELKRARDSILPRIMNGEIEV